MLKYVYTCSFALRSDEVFLLERNFSRILTTNGLAGIEILDQAGDSFCFFS